MKTKNKKVTVGIKDKEDIPLIEGGTEFEIKDGMYIAKSNGEPKLIIPLSNINYTNDPLISINPISSNSINMHRDKSKK